MLIYLRVYRPEGGGNAGAEGLMRAEDDLVLKICLGGVRWIMMG